MCQKGPCGPAGGSREAFPPLPLSCIIALVFILPDIQKSPTKSQLLGHLV